jgi:hypothetical protein
MKCIWPAANPSYKVTAGLSLNEKYYHVIKFWSCGQVGSRAKNIPLPTFLAAKKVSTEGLVN